MAIHHLRTEEKEGGEAVRGWDGGRDLNVRSVLRREITRREIARWNGQERHWLAQGGNINFTQLGATIMDKVVGSIAQFHLKIFYYNRKVQINPRLHWSDVTDMKKKGTIRHKLSANQLINPYSFQSNCKRGYNEFFFALFKEFRRIEGEPINNNSDL